MQTDTDFDIDYETEIDWGEVQRTIAANERDEWRCPNTKAEVDEELYQLLKINDRSPIPQERIIQCMAWLYAHGHNKWTAANRLAAETKDQRVTGDRIYPTPKVQVKPCMNV